MTFIGVNIQSFRIVHFVFDVLFTLTFLVHTFISTFIIRFRWLSVLKNILSGSASRTSKLRVIQWISSRGLFITGALQVVTGLDWFKLGLSSLLPYPLHREIDLFLLIFLIVHVAVGVHFKLLQRRVGQELPVEVKMSHERREAIAVLGGAVLALFSALYLRNPPRVGTDSPVPGGTLPPGQTEIEQLRVLHTGIGIPEYDPEAWRFEVFGQVDTPLSFTMEEFRALPSVIRESDFHCVTGWTKFGNRWEGVTFSHIKNLAKVRPNAKYATIECLSGYTTSLSIPELLHQDVVFAYRLDDEELPRQHGGPLRLVVPQKYAYKSAKWVIKVKFTEVQELGYWETRGYSNTANPFTNDRYSSN
jgi:DMSO/TMAO reductase YedYZ molybdopterin-dependent catalytic subunit